MRRIRRRDTKPEILLRSALHRRGYRFRVDVGDLVGRPDIVFPKRRVAVLVHGCFWHAHPGCKQASDPKTNRSYWSEKLAKNVARDQANMESLTALGYRVIVVWECDIEGDLSAVVRYVEALFESAI